MDFFIFKGFRLRLGMDGEELTEQETALYDRQIRVWGAGAQRRYIHICDYKVKHTGYKVSIFIKHIFHELILLFVLFLVLS